MKCYNNVRESVILKLKFTFSENLNFFFFSSLPGAINEVTNPTNE